MIIENNDIDIPSYLDEKFFTEALENGLREDRLEIQSIRFAAGSGGGENFCSNIYRAVISFSRINEKPENISVIIKSMPISEHNDFLVTLNVFVREKVIYFDVLPKIETLLKNSIKFGPKCYYSLGLPVRTIIFEDLKCRGYVNADREHGLDEEHCRLVLTKLGKFHAASMALAENEPSIMKHFPAGICSPVIIDKPAFHAVFTVNLDYLSANIVTQWQGFEKIAEKLRKVHNNLKERCLNVMKPRDGELKVLNHGDMWVNNFMFKYDEVNPSKPIDTYFVDFQMSFFSSPGIDLNYFFNTSPKFDVLKYKREQLLRTYHQALETTLNELGFANIPTFNDIQNEVRHKEFYGLINAIGLFPLLAMDKSISGDNSIESFIDEEVGNKKRHLMFTSKRFEETMKYSLKRFDELGVLDEE